MSTRYTVHPARARQLREALHLAPGELARLLRIGYTSLHRYETRGAPGWFPFALGGLAMLRDGMGVAEAAAVLGIDPDAGPAAEHA